MSSFEGRLAQLLSSDYPTSVARDFIKELLDDLKERHDRIADLVADYSSDPKGAEDQLRSEHRKFVLRFPFLDALENAQTRRVPWSFVPSIESMAKDLIPGKRILTSSDSAYNYSIQFWEPGASGRLYDFYILRLPSLHRLDALLHVLIGHELFHPILSPFFDIAQPAALARLRDQCSQLLQGEPQIGPLFEAKRLDTILEVTRQIWRRALEELMCDMGCVVLFGPAAVLALLTFALSTSLDTTPVRPGFYPPSRFRLRVMLNYGFGKDGYAGALTELEASLNAAGELADTSTVFREHWDRLKAAVLETDDLAAIDRDPLAKIAYSEVHNHLEDAWMFVKNIPSSGKLSWSAAQAEIPSHLRAFRRLVPSGEVRTSGEMSGPPSTASAVAIAACLQALQDEHRLSTEPIAVALDEHLRAARLTLKSLEDSEVKRVYLERKGK